MNDRRHSQPKDVLSFGPFSLFAAERLLKKAEEPIPIGGRALDILIALAERAGEVVTHKELISNVWPDVTVEEANLRFQMAALRKALGDGRDGARYVSNVAGRGYCFVASITRSPSSWQISSLDPRKCPSLCLSGRMGSLIIDGRTKTALPMTTKIDRRCKVGPCRLAAHSFSFVAPRHVRSWGQVGSNGQADQPEVRLRVN